METTRALATRSAVAPVRLRLGRLAAATVLGLSLTAAPALAADEPAAEDGAAVEDHGEEEAGGKIQLAETPRDRVGLIFFGFLGAITLGAGVTAVRQLKGTRPQATGEFRWR